MSRYLSQDYETIKDGDMSSNITSIAYEIPQNKSVGLSLVFTGTPTGTFTVEISNDAVSWDVVTFVEGAVSAAGSAGNHHLSLKGHPFKYYRILYAASSGSGTLNGRAMIKE